MIRANQLWCREGREATNNSFPKPFNKKKKKRKKEKIGEHCKNLISFVKE